MGNFMQVAATRFKARCLQLMARVEKTGRTVIITRHGRPAAKPVPVMAKATTAFGRGRGRAKISGDLIAPTGATWTADAG